MKPYSGDLRKRVVEAVAAGTSRRAAAERFAVSVSTAIKWLQRWQQSGSVAAKPIGGSRSRLEDHAELLLGLVAAQPDLTLDELCEALRGSAITTSRSAVWRFFERRGISFKKNPARRRARAGGRGRGASGVAARAAFA